MLPKDRSLNLKRSFYTFLFERLSANWYVNYSEEGNEEIEKRVKEATVLSPPWWAWIDVNWLNVGQGIFSTSLIQINGNTVKEMDQYGHKLGDMLDDVQEQLNVNTIPLLDFSDDEEDPVATDNVLIPRFRGGPRPLPSAAGGTVNVQAVDYNVYVYRESVLP